MLFKNKNLKVFFIIINLFLVINTQAQLFGGQIRPNRIVGSITVLNCGSATNVGTLVGGQIATGVSTSIPYSGGNGEYSINRSYRINSHTYSR
jgi:hypothetical protein